MPKKYKNEIYSDEDIETARIIQSLFLHSPANARELLIRLSSLDLSLIRSVIIDELEAGHLDEKQGALVVAVLDLIGIGAERHRLMSIVTDDECEAYIRILAAMSLISYDPSIMKFLASDVGTAIINDIVEKNLADILTLQQSNRMADIVFRLLKSRRRDSSSIALLNRIEACRIGLGISCAEMYAYCIDAPGLYFVRNKILEFFIEEASDEGIAFLEASKTQELGVDEKLIQAALLRLRSTRIDDRRCKRKIKGKGFISNCDADGGYIAVGIFENPDQTVSVSELYMNVMGAICDGVLHPRLSPVSAEAVVKSICKESGCFFVEVSIEECAAAIIDNPQTPLTALCHGDDELKRATLRFLEAYPIEEFSKFSFNLVSITEESVTSLLNRQEYIDTWIFDVSDFESENIPLPNNAGPDDQWISQAVERIASSGKHKEIAAMAEHMSKWHAWKGETRLANLAASLAEEIRLSPVDSFLIRSMLERSCMQ